MGLYENTPLVLEKTELQKSEVIWYSINQQTSTMYLVDVLLPHRVVTYTHDVRLEKGQSIYAWARENLKHKGKLPEEKIDMEIHWETQERLANEEVYLKKARAI